MQSKVIRKKCISSYFSYCVYVFRDGMLRPVEFLQYSNGPTALDDSKKKFVNVILYKILITRLQILLESLCI